MLLNQSVSAIARDHRMKVKIGFMHGANVSGVDIAVEIEECLVAAEASTDWEYSFIRIIGGFHRISERQHEILDRILAKVRRAERRQAA